MQKQFCIHAQMLRRSDAQTLRCFDAQMLRRSEIQMLRWSDAQTAQLLRRSYALTLRHSDAQTLRCSCSNEWCLFTSIECSLTLNYILYLGDALILRDAQMLRHSDALMLKWSDAQMLRWSDAQMLRSSCSNEWCIFTSIECSLTFNFILYLESILAGGLWWQTFAHT